MKGELYWMLQNGRYTQLASLGPSLCGWLGGADRFSSSRKVVRFVGLDITAHSSDGKRSPGRLSRQGPEVLRWLLFEAAKDLRPRRRARLRLLHPGQRPLRRELGLPVASPPDRPAGHPVPLESRIRGLTCGSVRCR